MIATSAMLRLNQMYCCATRATPASLLTSSVIESTLVNEPSSLTVNVCVSPSLVYGSTGWPGELTLAAQAPTDQTKVMMQTSGKKRMAYSGVQTNCDGSAALTLRYLKV